MKATALFMIGVVFALALNATVVSQTNQPPAGHLQRLQLIHAENAKLIEKQKATLQKLEEMTLQAHQIKFFTQRS